MSKALKKIVCVIVCLSMAFGGISVPNLFTVKGEQTKYMGSGSIAEGLPKALQSDASKLPSKSNSNVTRFTTDNYDNNNGAFDTNNWGTSAMWNFNGNNKYSGSMYTYPLAFKAAKDGMWISKPSTRIGSTYCVMTLTTNGDYTDFSVRPDFSTENAKVDKISDWTYDVVLENKNDNSQYLKTTIVQGSPFGFFTLKNSKKLTVAKYRKDVDSKIIYYDGTTLKNSSYVVLKVYDDIDEKNGYPKYDYYGIYLPKGTTLTQTDNSSSSVGNINIEFPSEQKAYFSMAWLTESDGSDAEALAIAKEYKAYAYNFITDTKAEYTYNQQVSTVSTKYIYTVDKKSESTVDGTIMGIMPHQYKNIKTNISYMKNTARTLRGTVKFVKGSSFTTELKYSGVLPFVTGVADNDKSKLKEYVNEYMTSKMPINGNYELCVDETNGDPYAYGKQLNRASNMLAAAEDVNDTESSERILRAMEKSLEDWFTYSGDGDGKYFAYDDGIGSLFSFPSSYNSIDQMNDHHFHYGYFIAAAAQVGLRDKQWIKKYAPVIEELIDDIACTKQNSKDSRYPYMRNFSPFEGHSWASGFEDPESGNNQESTSEAMNAWYGVILYGTASDNEKIKDLGIYLYTTELSAINSYWFDIDQDVLDSKYVKQGTNQIKNNMASLVWSGKYDYATWFSADPAMVQGIQLLPITAGSYYLATNKEYIKNSIETLKNKGNSKSWNDIWSEYLAMADPDGGFDRWGGSTPENGETNAHIYQFIKSLQKAGTPETGITSNTELSMVFKDSNGEKTYAVYNADSKIKTVQFSDGAKFSAAPNKMTIRTESQMKGQEYYVEYYVQNVSGQYDLEGTDIQYGKNNEKVQITPTEKKGYIINKEKSVLEGTIKSGGTHLKVYYDRGKYNITYQLNGGICNNMVNSYVYGETIELPTPRKENSVFRGWYTDASYSNRIEKIDSDVYGNITLYARWASAGDCYINDNLYMTMNGYKATFVALNDSASNIIVLYHIYDTIDEATEAYNNDSIAGYIGQELGKNNGYWSKDIDLTSYKDKYIVFAFNIISEHGTISEKGFKKITNAPGNPDESIVVPTTKENVTTTKPAGNTTWSKVTGNDSLEYSVTAGETKLVLIKYEAGKVYVGLNLAAKFSSVTWDDKNMTPEAGAFVNISDADLSSGRYHTLKVVDYYNKESVTILFKNTNISEETTTVNETKVDQETTAELEGLIKIEGVCINTKIGGMKIVAKVTDSINNKKVTKFGLIYGLLKYNGKKTGITSDHLKIGMEGQFVRSYNTTQKGIWKKTDNTTTYVETMTYGANSKEAYTAEYKARAYAVLEDGEIVYSNAIDYSVYEIAEQLYNNCMMPTIDGHKYLYNTILTKVTPEYTEKIYK